MTRPSNDLIDIIHGHSRRCCSALGSRGLFCNQLPPVVKQLMKQKNIPKFFLNKSQKKKLINRLIKLIYKLIKLVNKLIKLVNTLKTF
jgi:hypothetical protein